MKFKVINHLEIIEKDQAVNLTEFSFEKNESPIDGLLQIFITSRSFTHESLADVVKENLGKDYLRQAFVSDLLTIDDFKKMSKNDLKQFLEDFSNTPDWDDDKNEFLILKEKFLKILLNVGTDDFYVIDKDWFTEEDKKVRDPEYWIYAYYFLVFWIYSEAKIISVAEWAYD